MGNLKVERSRSAVGFNYPLQVKPDMVTWRLLGGSVELGLVPDGDQLLVNVLDERRRFALAAANVAGEHAGCGVVLQVVLGLSPGVLENTADLHFGDCG